MTDDLSRLRGRCASVQRESDGFLRLLSLALKRGNGKSRGGTGTAVVTGSTKDGSVMVPATARHRTHDGL